LAVSFTPADGLAGGVGGRMTKSVFTPADGLAGGVGGRMTKSGQVATGMVDSFLYAPRASIIGC